MVQQKNYLFNQKKLYFKSTNHEHGIMIRFLKSFSLFNDINIAVESCEKLLSKSLAIPPHQLFIAILIHF